MADGKKVVLVNGTGTIGEPLISLLLGIKDKVGIDEVLFYKHSPRLTDRPMLNDLIRRGAKMVTEESKKSEFEQLGLKPAYTLEEALNIADVVADATKEGIGEKNKELFYSKHENHIKGFLAQGSESNFGIIYANGINDEIFTSGPLPKYVQIASCNTHAAAALVKHLGYAKEDNFEHADLTFIRRASDVSQDKSVPAPTISAFDDEVFGTHHAQDVHRIFKTLGKNIDIFSSAIKVNSQYMHSLSAHLKFKEPLSRDEIISIVNGTPQLALTNKTSVNKVFSFGRDHGYYGRILNQSVIVEPSVKVNGDHLYLWSMTPQDGNSILSSIKAILYYLYEENSKVEELMKVANPWLFNEV